MSSAPLIVFDLDGTLIDTAPDLVGALNAVLAKERIEPADFDDARRMIGGGGKAMITRALEQRRIDVASHDIERMFAAFIDYYADHIADHSRPFPGLSAALDALAAEGFRFAVCTNKLEWLARKLLDALSLTDRFAFICGQDTFGTKKPDPEVLRRTIASCNGDMSRAIMVGDSVLDIQVARAAGTPVIAVDFGYTEVPVVELLPDSVISSYEALQGAVREICGQTRR